MDNREHSLFFISSLENGRAFFSSEERHHALSVLRKDPSCGIHATDGKGNIYTCLLREGTLEADIGDMRKQPAPRPLIHAFIGIPEREAFEETVTNLAALGMAKITPVVCRYCQEKWWIAWEKHGERCQKKMVAGIKQSLNAWLPELTAPMEFGEALEMIRGYDSKRCIVADAGGMSLESAIDLVTDPANVACFIGPPGGFSPGEMDTFKSLGFVFIKIANTRLRTELAAVVLCAQLISKSIVACIS
jgi:16S rRNA (uracil1498-N3)-methyltransferase